MSGGGSRFIPPHQRKKDVEMGKLDITAEYQQVKDKAGKDVPILVLKFSDRNTKAPVFQFGIGKPQLEMWTKEMSDLEAKWIGAMIMAPMGGGKFNGNEEEVKVDGLEEATKDP